MQAADHLERRLVAVEPRQERHAGLVVVGRCGEDLLRERLGGAEDVAVGGRVPAIERLDRGRRVGRERRERAEQRVGVAALVALDEADVVEVVAREHAGGLGQPLAHGDLGVGVEQAHLHARHLVAVVLDDLQQRGRRGIRVVGAEVAGERRVERGAEPVQHDRAGGGAEHLAVDAAVVVGGLRGAREMAARHQHDAGAGVLRVVELLLVGVDHLLERDGLVADVVGVDADDEVGTHGCRFGGTAGDQFARGEGVEPHVALRGVHGVGDAEPPRPDVVAEGEGGVPVDLGRLAGSVVGERLRHHVRGRVGHPARERMPRLRERRRLRERHGAEGAGAVDEGDGGHGQRAPVSSAACADAGGGGIRCARGIRRRALERDDGQVDAATLGGGAQPLLGEEHAAGAGEEVVVVGGVLDDVADELLPLRLEAVLEHVVRRHLDPVAVVVVRVGQVGVPHRLRGGVARLDLAAEEADDRRAERAVDLELDELVAVHPGGPARVELRDHAALELEDRVGRVVGGGRVGVALLVDALGDLGDRPRVHGLDATEQVLEHVVPVREHVDDDAAAVLGAVVPAGALRRLPVALEDPVAELAAHARGCGRRSRSR